MLQTGRNPATPGDELVVGHCSAELGGGIHSQQLGKQKTESDSIANIDNQKDISL